MSAEIGKSEDSLPVGKTEGTSDHANMFLRTFEHRPAAWAGEDAGLRIASVSALGVRRPPFAEFRGARLMLYFFFKVEKNKTSLCPMGIRSIGLDVTNVISPPKGS